MSIYEEVLEQLKAHNPNMDFDQYDILIEGAEEGSTLNGKILEENSCFSIISQTKEILVYCISNKNYDVIGFIRNQIQDQFVEIVILEEVEEELDEQE